jgi:hypothetical protein
MLSRVAHQPPGRTVEDHIKDRMLLRSKRGVSAGTECVVVRRLEAGRYWAKSSANMLAACGVMPMLGRLCVLLIDCKGLHRCLVDEIARADRACL